MNPFARTPEQRVGWALHAAGGVAVVFVVWAYCVCVYQPLVGERERMDARSDQVQTLLGKSVDVQRRHRLLREKLDELETSVASLAGRLPEELEKNEFERQVRQVAAATGLEVVGVEHRRPELTATHDQAEAGFQFRGSFAGVCRLVAEVNQFARITKISKVELESEPNSPGNQVQIDFVLYYGVESDDGDEKGAVL